MNIIQSLLFIIQQLSSQNKWLLAFICKYIPLRQWAFDDSHSPKYEKFKTDILPRIIPVEHKNWRHLLLEYKRSHNGFEMPQIRRRGSSTIPETLRCPCCHAPAGYIYRNNGDKGQFQCKVCGSRFSAGNKFTHKSYELRCPYCGRSLSAVKTRKEFTIWRCPNFKCDYYQKNLKKVKPDSPNGRSDYKLHYIYREFTKDFFQVRMEDDTQNYSSLKFRKFDSQIMGLCLTMHVNLQLSLRKTTQALKDLYGLHISHQQVANYCKTAAACIKPFVDEYPYEPGNTFVGDETYIKIRGVLSYVWFIMDAASRSIVGYFVSQSRSVGPCIMAMRLAFQKFNYHLPEGFRFIADGFSAYPLAAQQFLREFGEKMRFGITQVIGLTNDDAVSKQFRPYKQLIERFNRTYKASYRHTNGFDGLKGANYDLSLWIAYYNFLRPHAHNHYKVLNEVPELERYDNMPGKWQYMIYRGQQILLERQKHSSAPACS